MLSVVYFFAVNASAKSNYSIVCFFPLVNTNTTKSYLRGLQNWGLTFTASKSYTTYDFLVLAFTARKKKLHNIRFFVLTLYLYRG